MNTDKPLAPALLAALLALPAAAQAGKPPPTDPAWQEECGSCHVAYPPRFLPAESWRRVMAGLGDHFGSDASLDPARAAGITAFLTANARKPKAGTATDPATAPLRITQTRWFLGEHDEVRAATWRDPAVGSPANCGACHGNAERGSFREGEIKVPKGGVK